MGEKKLNGLAVLSFATRGAWSRWLASHHASSPGVWIQLAKKGSGQRSITYTEAVEVALCFGWIDSQAKGKDERSWFQKFTPRRSKSIWSKINRARAVALIASGEMRPAGLAEVQRAKQDGRWQAAYDSRKAAHREPDRARARSKSSRKSHYLAREKTNR